MHPSTSYYIPSLLTLTLVITSGSRIIGAADLGSFCTLSDPALHTLGRNGLGDFDCGVNEEIHELNCSDRGVPALHRTGDVHVPTDIQILDFSWNKIMCLPQINNTRSSCSITDCHSGCILDLRLQHNEITSLHQRSFQNLTCLQRLDLSHNRITGQALTGFHFFRLSHLHLLDLHRNPLGQLRNNVLISTHLSHLKTLNLSSCSLASLGARSLDDFFEMETLDLSRNELTELSADIFQGLFELTTLDLRWNKLTRMEKDTFADMKNLQDLRLSHNRLRFLSEQVFHPQNLIVSLDLSFNQFLEIPTEAASRLKSLEWMDMSQNPIVVLKKTSGKTGVRHLFLNSMEKLTNVEEDAFSSFPHLTHLSLRYCRRLRSVEAQAFRGSRDELREVHLDNNALASLDQGLLPWDRLGLLTLHENRWHCDCNLAWTVGRELGNTSIRCQDPLKLAGQDLSTLTPGELSCSLSLFGLQAAIGLSIATFTLTLLLLVLWPYRRRLPCRCLRGISGRYVTVFTKESRAREEFGKDTSCGDGEVDDLDLGIGSRSENEGQVRFMLSSFRNGYKKLSTKDAAESREDLTKVNKELV